MGVKLTDIVVKKKLSFDQLAHKRIAVDFSNAAYQFLSSIKQRDGTPLKDSKGNITSHLVGILSRTSNLLSQNIKLCYVFDGKPPALKEKVQGERKERKLKAEELYNEAKKDGNEESMLKYSKQFIRLTKEMNEESKELIDALGLPCIQAPSEADAQLAHICKEGDVWAGATTDFDLLLHGCPLMLTNLKITKKRKLPSGLIVKTHPELIDLNKTLNTLEISQEQLISLGILVGTDYNPGIKGIGPKKALKIIKEKKTPENIFKETNINYKEIIELFLSMKVEKNYNLEWKEPNEEKLKKILVDKHEFSEERIENTLNKIHNQKKDKHQTSLDVWTK